MQWNHVKSFKFEFFYDLERKFKALVIILEIGQFLSEQRAFEKKQLFLGHSVFILNSYKTARLNDIISSPQIVRCSWQKNQERIIMNIFYAKK